MLRVKSRQFAATTPAFNLPYMHLVPRLSFAEIFSTRKLESLAIVWRSLRDATFSCFSRTPTCDRQTDMRQQLIPTLDSITWVKTMRQITQSS